MQATLTAARPASVARPARRSLVVKAAWTSTGVKPADLAATGGRTVVEIGGQRVVLADDAGTVRAVSNKCSHLGLPLVGKTALLQGEVSGGCITCPAHKTKFNLQTGQPVGEWCPSMPNLPIVGKGPGPKPLPTFQSRVNDGGIIEVDI